MANMLDYLVWRGDLSLEQAGIGPVDALILSELSYLHFDRLVPEEPGEGIFLRIGEDRPCQELGWSI